MSHAESGRLIGLHGESRAGKDSVARFLVEDFGAEQRIIADPIRKILYDLNPWVCDVNDRIQSLARLVDEHGWDYVKTIAPEATQYMVRLGQSARDHIGIDVWLNAGFPDYSLDVDLNYVCSDVRQPNEAEFIQSLGGQVWRIIRPGTVDQGMDNLLKDIVFDQVIVNDGTLEDLRLQVHAAMDEERW